MRGQKCQKHISELWMTLSWYLLGMGLQYVYTSKHTTHTQNAYKKTSLKLYINCNSRTMWCRYMCMHANLCASCLIICAYLIYRVNNAGRPRGDASYTTASGTEQNVNRGTPASVRWNYYFNNLVFWHSLTWMCGVYNLVGKSTGPLWIIFGSQQKTLVVDREIYLCPVNQSAE